VPVRREGELIAIMLAGPKLGGPLLRDDVDWNDGEPAAIGLKNSQLYQEIVSIRSTTSILPDGLGRGGRDDGIVTTFNL
jgi:hypothetical protein